MLENSEDVKDLAAFADNNKETQGKKTIGDEKVGYLGYRVPSDNKNILIHARNTMSS